MVENTKAVEETAAIPVKAPSSGNKKKKGINPLAKRENLVGWLFCTPIIIGILAFTALPVILSIISMFYDWNGLKFVTDAEFVGFGLFKNVFSAADHLYWKALLNTLLFAIQLPVCLIVGIFLALAMNRSMKGVQTFRILYYLPSVMSIVAITIVFQKLFDRSGYINKLFGLDVDWLGKKSAFTFTVNFLMVWKGIGYTALMYIAGLQSVSTDQLEAARIDGATPWIIFYKITLPALYPITFYLLVTGVMGSLQVFNEPFILAQSSDSEIAVTAVSYVYSMREAMRLGEAAVASWFLAILIFIVTMIQMYFDNKKDKEA